MIYENNGFIIIIKKICDLKQRWRKSDYEKSVSNNGIILKLGSFFCVIQKVAIKFIFYIQSKLNINFNHNIYLLSAHFVGTITISFKKIKHIDEPKKFLSKI